MGQANSGHLVVRGARATCEAGVETALDLHIRDGFFVDGRRAPSPDPSTEVVDAQSAYAVPLLVESALTARTRGERSIYDLQPGNPATFALIGYRASEAQIRTMLVVVPNHLLAVYVRGHREVWRGSPTRPAGEDLVDPATRHAWVGTWEDPGRALQQHLKADGRYSETRGGRENAYTGHYWVRGERITYLDDSGFWAFGELLRGTLHHAGFVMRRRGTS